MVFHQKHNSVTPYNINIFTYKNNKFLPHFHKDFELIYVIKGSIEVFIDGKYFDLNKGDFCLVFSGQTHAIEQSNNSIMWVCVFSDMFVPLFAEFMQNKTAENVFKCDTDFEKYFYENFIQKNSIDATNLITYINQNDEIKSPALSSDKLISYSGYLNLICSKFLESVTFYKCEKSNFDLYKKITEYIYENFKKDITLDSLADYLGYEKHYVSRYFNKWFNTNFKQFINEYRVGYAEELLKRHDLSVTEVAYKAGFGSVRSFNRVFKSIMDKTPSQIIE